MSDAPTQDQVREYFDDPSFPRLPPGCGVPHPEIEGVFCEKIAPCLDHHRAATVSEIGERTTLAWDNPEKTPKRVPNHPKAKAMADRVDGKPGPIVGTDDPENSHVAAEQIEPTRGTKRAQVLDALRVAKGEWVDAPSLATEDVGGFGGTRRMRELRDMGWNIETRQKPGVTNVWQHRLIE